MPLARRNFQILFEEARRKLKSAISRWIAECTFVTASGTTEPNRAWQCYRDWIEAQRRIPGNEDLQATLSDAFFHQVVRANHAAKCNRYSVTVSASLVAAVLKPVQRASKPRTSRQPLKTAMPGKN